MFRQTLIAASVSMLLLGCGAGDEPYKEVPKAAEQQAWRAFDTGELWLYVPSTADAPRYASNMDPFFQGDEKVVRLQFVEEGLRVVQVDRDTTAAGQPPRWNDVAPVLTIPGDYRDYRCAEDAYGECTRKEEENTDKNVTWDKKAFFHPVFKDLKGHEINTIDLWYNNDSISETADPRVVRWEMDAEKGVINVELERTFTVKRNALDDYYNQSLSDLSFTTSFYYSLVKLDKIASPGYKPIRYAPDDESEFGFFTSEFDKLDAQGSATDGSKRAYLNRFNPGKATIDYYLSDTFFKPENKLFLDVTLDSVRHINQSLAGTGVPPLNIVNPSAPAGRQVGDLRVSMINLIDRPLANGLLGYGPSVANPLTGEIVKAHVNQYSGVIKTAVPRVWNDLARRFNRQELKADGIMSGIDFAKLADPANAMKASVDLSEQQVAQVEKSFTQQPLRKEQATLGITQTTQDSDLKTLAKANAERLKRWSENNAFGEEAIWVSATSKGLVSGIDYQDASLYEDDAKTRMKKWKALDEGQRERISTAISAHMYRSTLVHELGHNLGLRHNFAGSRDKKNFYSPEEAKSLGLQHVPAYSSIMDYAASEFDELPIFGPYDRAALRFAYARQLEVPYGEAPKDGEGKPTGPRPAVLLPLDELDLAYLNSNPAVNYGQLNAVKTLLDKGELLSSWQSLDNSFQEQLKKGSLARKPYDFCTDGNVSLNSNCKRFDEGTNLAEIMAFRRQNYVDSYERRNTRLDKQEFWDNTLMGYTVGRLNEFSEVRDFIEDFERIDTIFRNAYGSGDEKPGEFLSSIVTSPRFCNPSAAAPTDAWFCAYGRAAMDAADFMLDVIARPDKVCEVQDSSGNISQLPLTKLYGEVKYDMPAGQSLPMSCFAPGFGDALAKHDKGYKVLSETRDGVPLDSVSPNDPNHPFSNERDVLGAWPDKLLAMKFLVSRDTRRWTENGDALALIDLPMVESRLKAQIRAMVLGEALPEQPVFVDKDGRQVFPFSPYRWDSKRTLEGLNPSLATLANYFDLDSTSNARLNKAMLSQILKWGQTGDSLQKESARRLVDYISLPLAADEQPALRTLDYKGRKFTFGNGNVLAWDSTNLLFDRATNQGIKTLFDTINLPAYALRLRAVYGDVLTNPNIRNLFSGEQRVAMAKAAITLDKAMLDKLSAAWLSGKPYGAALGELTVSATGYKLGSGPTYTDSQLQQAWATFDGIGRAIKQEFWGEVVGWLPQWSEQIRAHASNSALSTDERTFWRGERALIAFVLAQTSNQSMLDKLTDPLESIPATTRNNVNVSIYVKN
ncbi:hypothetical protein ATO46_16280 [Aeromonas schubertii]|uniref:zinc-dependent metalloprotease n=1 Tax=Aeromonas schubertii TaxID=652 RepID=UPI00067ECD2A|nr:zinc-dependent metalloprotease [Aeromonas schubertii]KUE80525.1 hypothetical protein ATO46_16280 [Aeromonas schubertii]